MRDKASYLYLRENREIILLCERYCSISIYCNISIELNGTVVTSGYANKRAYGNTIYEFITNRKDNHNIYTCSLGRDDDWIKKMEIIINCKYALWLVKYFVSFII